MVKQQGRFGKNVNKEDQSWDTKRQTDVTDKRGRRMKKETNQGHVRLEGGWTESRFSCLVEGDEEFLAINLNDVCVFAFRLLDGLIEHFVDHRFCPNLSHFVGVSGTLRRERVIQF